MEDNNNINIITDAYEVSDIDMVDINPSDKVILRDFQINAVEIMKKNEKEHGIGSILAFSMGLGKTLSMASFLLEQRENEIDSFNELSDLIVVPLAVMSQWRNELLRLRSDINILIYHGSKRVGELKRAMEESRPDFVISTYHSLITRELECYNWNRVVLDEAHIIRNGIESSYKSIPKKAIGAFALGEISRFCHCITGTPFNNRTNDILSLMKFVGYKECDAKNVPGFVDYFVIQKTKEDIMEPIITETILLDKPAQGLEEYNNLKRQYNAAVSALRRVRANLVESRALFNKAMMLLTKLRIFCNLMQSSTFNRVFEDENEDDEYEYYEDYPFTLENKLGFYDSSPKIKAICDKTIESLPTVPFKRIIIFSSFVSTLDVIESVLNDKNPDIITYQYTGKKNREIRECIVEAFTNTEETRPMVLLASLGAASCGINLTPCATVYLADISMNPFDQLQAVNRVHRITQTNIVNVSKFCMKDMVESNILLSHDRKMDEAKSNGLIMLA